MLRKLVIALAVTVLSVSASSAAAWVKLGACTIYLRFESNTISVSRHDGKFKRLKVIVRRFDLRLRGIKLYYDNGEEEEVLFERYLSSGQEAVIELPHGWTEGRFIKDVEVHYIPRPNDDGEAQAELWGQE
jgi:hypothetical protein